MKKMLLLMILFASTTVAQDVIKSLVIEPGFNIGVTRQSKLTGVTLDQEALRAMGSKLIVGKIIPGQVSNPEMLATFGLTDAKTGDKVKVTYLGHDGIMEKFQVEHTGLGRKVVIRVAAEALQVK
jgi:hypothetical protein